MPSKDSATEKQRPPSCINIYGDVLIHAGQGHGADISTQREDELDMRSMRQLLELRSCGRPARILDLGSGRGAQAARLINAGASLGVAIDKHDFASEFQRMVAGSDGIHFFLQEDLTGTAWRDSLLTRVKSNRFDIVIFQRAIHYLQYGAALQCLEMIRGLMTSDSRLYLSASGIASELGDAYAYRSRPINNRFGRLSPEMAWKHGIHEPVCLYAVGELLAICETAGLRVIDAMESPFKNVKVVAGLG